MSLCKKIIDFGFSVIGVEGKNDLRVFLIYMDIVLTLYAIIAFLVIGVGLAAMILYVRMKLVSDEACEINVNNNSDFSFSVGGGTTLLNALTSHGIPIPSPCGGKATCKQCKVQILEGAAPALETDKGSFTKKQLAEGWRLSCQCKVKGPMHVKIDEHTLSTKEWMGTVLSNENVATFIKELIVEVPEEVPYQSGGYLQVHVPAFKTNTSDWKQTMEQKYRSDWDKYSMFGQTIDFSHLKGDDIRAYSMASYPAEGKKIIFNIRIATPPFVAGKLSDVIPWGICSSYTFSLKPGDKIRLSGPYGESFMRHDNRELVFLIGGAGSSFGRSHVLHLFNTDKTKRKVSFWYGARSLKENIYEEEYKKLAAECPNFTYHLVLSEPTTEDVETGWPTQDPIKTNFLFRAFEKGQLAQMEEPEEALFYVCGPPMHNSSVMKLLDDYGVPRDNIVLDDFGS